ncbi:uncharacterized protein BDZ99DRAFT_79522 [Mytilinidion resinicola]|uniref:Uncharacterized protein n=1 Tax=Mytilinidion resinicola TaxID=574789 RepID=A0A6A6YF17_9PEZI|nr:uncharacterized protein BDZ99DRAFT_79522 [Mytilinidion resinicola]KAF2807392.1 hypothetical protein BDZ99DRAFT_79522 [Mytilinidion resinicola]
MHVLLELSNNRHEALDLAVKATSTAFCAMELANPAVLREACKLYGRALAAHSSCLTKERSNPNIHNIGLICTSVVLSLYEAMDGTSSAGFISHITGSTILMELALLEGHSQCLLQEVLYYVRFHQTFLSLLGRSDTPHSSNPLSYIGLSDKVPTVQRLLNLASVLLTFYPSAPMPQIPDAVILSQISKAIDDLWLEYTTTSARLSSNTITWTDSSGVHYRDAMTALILMYFSAVHVLHALASSSSEHELDAYSTADVIDYHARILNAAAFLYQKRIGCAYNRMSLPLYLVAVHGPLAVQRMHARNYFEHWRLGGTMAGISKLALERMEEVETTQPLFDNRGLEMKLPARLGVAG